ncbi:unnamed protein product, partial [Prorocentrum cordatum]
MSAYDDSNVADWLLAFKIQNGFLEEVKNNDMRETRSDPGDLFYPEPSLHGHTAGQTVYWATRDAAYGMKGTVVRGSSRFNEASLLVSFKGENYHVKLDALSTRRQVRGPFRGGRAAGSPVAEASDGGEVPSPRLHGYAVGTTVFWNVKKRRLLGPRKGDSMHGMKGVVVGESDEFTEPSLLVAFKGRDFHGKVNAISRRRPKKSPRATSPFEVADASSTATAGWYEESDDASPQVVGVGDAPSAAQRGRRAAAGTGLPHITIGTRLLFVALLDAVCGPISMRKAPFANVCIKKNLRNLGYKIAIDEDGPYYALRDGNRFLEPFGKALKYVQGPRPDAFPMKYVVHVHGYHFIAVKTFEDGYDVIDDKELLHFDENIGALVEALGPDATWYAVTDASEVSEGTDESEPHPRDSGGSSRCSSDAGLWPNGAASASDRTEESVTEGMMFDQQAFGAYLRRLDDEGDASDADQSSSAPDDADSESTDAPVLSDGTERSDADSLGDPHRGEPQLRHPRPVRCGDLEDVDRWGGMDSGELYPDDARRRILEKWEPAKYRRLQGLPGPALQAEVEPDGGDVREAAKRIVAKTDELLQAWDPQPAGAEYYCMRLLTMCATGTSHWNANNDLLVTRIAALILSDVVAHTDGVYICKQGSFGRSEEIPTTHMYRVESVLSMTQVMLVKLMKANALRNVDTVFQFLESDVGTWASGDPVCSIDLQGKKDGVAAWAHDARKGLRDIVGRFTGKMQSERLVELLGSWTHVPKPEAPFVSVAFEDCAIKIDDGASSAAEGIVQIPKKRENLCYFGIPMQIVPAPPQSVVERLALFLATSFAGSEAGREMDLAMEALAWMGLPTPPVMVMLTGNGGNSKSARTVLRNSVFGGHHAVLAADVFQEPQECRKQGGQFAFAKCLTVQECAAGIALLEEIWKKFVSGEFMACRPLFGKTTQYYRWLTCAKFWETNRQFPRINGDYKRFHELRSIWRRLRVVLLKSVFTSNPGSIDVDEAVFREDADLMAFLEGDQTRLAYIKFFLWPFIQEYTASRCRQVLLDPDQSIVEETRRVVAQMANGGLEVPAEFITEAENRAQLDAARGIVEAAHRDAAGKATLKLYQVNATCKSVPGAYRPGAKGKATRLDNLMGAIDRWPHLIDVNEDTKELRFLSINYAKFSEIMGKYDDGVAQVKQLLEAYRLRGSRRGDRGVLKVAYHRKHGIPGRWYAAGPAMQSFSSRGAKSIAMTTEIGASAGGDMIFVDVDINNCCCTILVNLLREAVADMEDFRVLVSFSENYKQRRAFMMEYFDMPPKAAKKTVGIVLGMDRFGYLAPHFSERPNPRGSRIHFALAAVEEDIMNDLVRGLPSHVPSCEVNALMLDGAILRMQESSFDALLQHLENVGSKHGVSFSTDKFDRLGGAPIAFSADLMGRLKEEVNAADLSTCKAMVIENMAKMDQLQINVSFLTGARQHGGEGYLGRSAQLLRDSAGVDNLRNANDVRAHVILDVRGPRFAVDDQGIRITRNYRVTPEFLLLVASFNDSRTQSKYLRIRDRIIEHYISHGSELSFAVPTMNTVWEQIYKAGVQISAAYKKKCVDELSFRAMSFDSTYKYTLAVVGQTSHGKKKDDSDRSEFHCVHVMIADGVPVSCKPGHSEGVPELSDFIEANATLAQRRQAEIILFDTPEKWDMQKAQKLFPNLKCVGGDPLHAWMDLVKFIKEGDQLSRDFKKIVLKFNGRPAPSLQAKRYFDGSQPRGRAHVDFKPCPSDLRKAYERLQTTAYQEKAYLNHKQYCLDIMAAMSQNERSCQRPLTGRNAQSTVSDLLSRYMAPAKYLYYQNISVYRMRTGLPCQYGATPNEAVMFQLKAYNANVFASTRQRCEFTLDLFTFGK